MSSSGHCPGADDARSEKHQPATGPRTAPAPSLPWAPAHRLGGLIPPGLPPPLDANDSQTSVSSPAVRLPPPTTTAQEPRCYAPLSQFSAPAQNLGVILDFSLHSPLPFSNHSSQMTHLLYLLTKNH